jgi:hypothetical protein
MKICSKEVDSQTIMMKLIVVFHNFENGPEIMGKR